MEKAKMNDETEKLLTDKIADEFRKANGDASFQSLASNPDTTNKYRLIQVNGANVRIQKCLFCCSRRVKLYKNNKVSTSKYNILTFLPLNILL